MPFIQKHTENENRRLYNVRARSFQREIGACHFLHPATRLHLSMHSWQTGAELIRRRRYRSTNRCASVIARCMLGKRVEFAQIIRTIFCECLFAHRISLRLCEWNPIACNRIITHEQKLGRLKKRQLFIPLHYPQSSLENVVGLCYCV